MLIELAEIHAQCGDVAAAEGLIERARSVPALPDVFEDLIDLTNAELALRRADAVREERARLDRRCQTTPDLRLPARLKFVRASWAFQAGAPEARRDAASALHHAAAQGAKPVAAASKVLLAIADDGMDVAQAVRGAGAEFPWTLSMLAEILVERLDILDGPAAELIGQEAPPQTDAGANHLGM